MTWVVGLRVSNGPGWALDKSKARGPARGPSSWAGWAGGLAGKSGQALGKN